MSQTCLSERTFALPRVDEGADLHTVEECPPLCLDKENVQGLLCPQLLDFRLKLGASTTYASNCVFDTGSCLAGNISCNLFCVQEMIMGQAGVLLVFDFAFCMEFGNCSLQRMILICSLVGVEMVREAVKLNKGWHGSVLRMKNNLFLQSYDEF